MDHESARQRYYIRQKRRKQDREKKEKTDTNLNGAKMDVESVLPEQPQESSVFAFECSEENKNVQKSQ